MLYVCPDFYKNFKCIASECRHSCCIGWEIDIDEDTVDYYASLDAPIARELRANIAAEPQPHLILGEGERCPFLRQDGLCRLILELGEDSLCDICTEHPRFYNEFAGRMEAGLGLCCEEAARLLLEGDKALSFDYEDDGEEEDTDEISLSIFELRESEFSRLSMDKAYLYSQLMPMLESKSISQWAELYLSLERLDESWTDALNLLKEQGDRANIKCALEHIKFRRMAAYFLYRHLPASESLEEGRARVAFAYLSTAIVCCLEALGLDCRDALRMYSSEIEYSDENVEIILKKLK